MAVLSIVPPATPPSLLDSDPTQDLSSPNSDPTSLDFGNPETLTQIRSLTDVGTMTRLLHECIAYQRSLDVRLDSLLSSRPDLDRGLLALRRSSSPLLSLARSDSSLLLSSLSSTASLADQVSSRVRQLDLAQSRVHLALSRIDAALHRSQSLDAARRSLDVEDYDSAAASVHSFLQIDAQFPSSSASEQRQQLLALKSKLESIIKAKLAAAVDAKDHNAILRFVRILPALGLQDDGLKIYVNYLRSVVGFRSKLEFEHLKEISTDPAQDAAGSNFVACLTNLFKDIVLAVEENDEVLRNLGGEDGVVFAISSLQEECDSRGTQILKRYMDYRKITRLATEINSSSKNLLSVGVPEGPDPREVETYLEEILSLMHLGEDYTEFMMSKIRGLGFVDPEFGSKAVKRLSSGSFNGVVQELIGYYLVLEEFFMVENVRKAISIDEQQLDGLTTSMVDDVFFVLQSCCRRAISTGSMNSVFAVLSGATSLLSNEYQEALQQKMREPNLGAKLFLGGVGVQKTGTEIATALNNIDVSAEYVLKLRHEIEEQCGQVFPAPVDREKVKTCLSEFAEMHNVFKQVLNAGMEQLGSTITPRIRPVLDTVATISYELSDAEYEENEMNDPWVQKLLHAVESNIFWLQPFMTSNNYDLFVHLVIDFIVKRLEVIMMQKRFSQLGGLQLDREVRALVNHFSEMSQRPVRDKFARLSQMTTILNFERVSEILDFWGENAGHMTWLLTPSEVRRVLGLRLDFKPETIAALRL
ncbi:conserved oligomeric Golgi complex subunit 4-like [Asparagus officinalis]|uniref:conserved oligomeric Golgi complex subunit 4-like n=1 Tax=Asparagus officinalis TaxID=4686 RepID=UPI00098E7882|nr:conserved oligomeric Golgi complex subunit 4-like [Asparagus officinalis]